jgi:hypothetical protein
MEWELYDSTRANLYGGFVFKDHYLLLSRAGYSSGLALLEVNLRGEVVNIRNLCRWYQSLKDQTSLMTSDAIYWAGVNKDSTIIFKVNREGQIVYKHTTTGFTWSSTVALYEMKHGGVLLCGNIDNNNKNESTVIKVSADGVTEWKQTFVTDNDNLIQWAVQYDDDSYHLKAGRRTRPASKYTYTWNIFLNADGEVISDLMGKTQVLTGRPMTIGLDYYSLMSDFARWTCDDTLLWSVAYPQAMSVLEAAYTNKGGFWIMSTTARVLKYTRDPLDNTPFWANIPDTTVEEDHVFSFERRWLHDYLKDVDNDLNQIEISVTEGDSFELESDGEWFFITPKPDWWGDLPLTLTATDPQGNATKTTLPLRVLPVNDPLAPFSLVLPSDNTSPVEPYTAFVWSASSQVPYEPDSIVYRFYLAVDGFVYARDGISDRFLVIDLWEVLGEIGFTPDFLLESALWWVTAVDREDSVECDARRSIDLRTLTAEKGTAVIAPTDLGLASIYPNPFNNRTHIRYTVDKPGIIHLELLDVTGRVVKTLQEGNKSQGEYECKWQSESTAAGLYLVRLRDNTGRSRMQKVILLK